LYSHRNRRYLCVETTSQGTRAGMVRSSVDSPAACSAFQLERSAAGTYALRSVANGLYLSVDSIGSGTYQSLVRASSPTPGSRSQFALL